MKLTSFEIKGLFGTKSVKLNFISNALVIVGPNGIGKSTVINIFYYLISKQWKRLLDYDFDELVLVVDAKKISVKRNDILGTHSIESVLGGVNRVPSRFTTYLKKLDEKDLLESFIKLNTIDKVNRDKYSKALDVPKIEVRTLHRVLLNRLDIDELPSKFSSGWRKELEEIVQSRVLYLPTYRRIEKDIMDIFPDFEDKYRKYSSETNNNEYSRTGKYYVELVSFGMEDVKYNLEKTTQALRDYSLERYNNLSAEYLKNVIQGKANQFDHETIKKLKDDDITSILSRVSETALSKKDKASLRDKIKSIQCRKKTESTDLQEEYLAHYFLKLKNITEDLKTKEASISSFKDVCNTYLQSNKKIVYTENTFQISIEDDNGTKINLSALSSGEKQVISLFAHLYLDGNKNQIVVIDEPELSLSVPWQKKFLPDILKTENCQFLLAVTHSPFIFENELADNTVDLRKVTS